MIKKLRSEKKVLKYYFEFSEKNFIEIKKGYEIDKQNHSIF